MENKIKCSLCGRVFYDFDAVVVGANAEEGVCFDCVATCVEKIKEKNLFKNFRKVIHLIYVK